MDKTTFQTKVIWIICLVGILIIGFGLRLTDLDDPPLDFNPTRQLRYAIIARGYYYERSPNLDPDSRAMAISHKDSMERLEPPVFETIVA